MTLSKESTIKVIQDILGGKTLKKIISKLQKKDPTKFPLLSRLPRQLDLSSKAQHTRIDLINTQNLSFEHLTGANKISDPEIFSGNIENYIGTTQVPTGVIGPLRINGINAQGDFYVPMATTEGALIASYNRGARALSMSGGVTSICLQENVSRSPAFKFNNVIEAGQFISWCNENIEEFKNQVSQTTSHGKLNDIKTTIVGNLVYLNLEYTTGDASGQNMVTIASDAICQYIKKNSPISFVQSYIEGNLSGDKKATSISNLLTRGKKVTAEAIISRKILKKYLHVTPEELLEYWKVSAIGGIQSGSIGINGHIANGLAAIFLACGQDVACVSEATVGITRFDIQENGDFYISVTLPNLIVGTVGGGTNLPTQSECLSLMDCLGTNKARKFAEIVAGSLLAGELSISAAIAAGHFTEAHKVYGRRKK